VKVFERFIPGIIVIILAASLVPFVAKVEVERETKNKIINDFKEWKIIDVTRFHSSDTVIAQNDVGKRVRAFAPRELCTVAGDRCQLVIKNDACWVTEIIPSAD
jgi:hypothetical protein